jgi:hypothetical protein
MSWGDEFLKLIKNNPAAEQLIREQIAREAEA